MDFTFNEEQRAVRDAASGVFAGMVTPQGWLKSKPVTSGSTASCGRRSPPPTCSGWPCPSGSGGAGLGLLELCLVLEAQGAVVAPVPLWAALVAAAFPSPASATPSAGPRCSVRSPGVRSCSAPPSAMSPPAHPRALASPPGPTGRLALEWRRPRRPVRPHRAGGPRAGPDRRRRDHPGGGRPPRRGRRGRAHGDHQSRDPPPSAVRRARCARARRPGRRRGWGRGARVGRGRRRHRAVRPPSGICEAALRQTQRT